MFTPYSPEVSGLPIPLPPSQAPVETETPSPFEVDMTFSDPTISEIPPHPEIDNLKELERSRKVSYLYILLIIVQGIIEPTEFELLMTEINSGLSFPGKGRVSSPLSQKIISAGGSEGSGIV